ncbi:MAG: beta-ketoacyl synthase chain length factor [Burkholderiales bacterium]|nr:beta-ketoacyl synthase chain length factor [Burkholderiales bacterium]
MMKAFIEGIGLLGPGLPGWNASRAILAGTQPHVAAPMTIPTSDWLPPAERRRTGVSVRLALATGREACEQSQRDPGTLATVFTSSGGDSDNQHAICETLATTAREVSPTRFHNSVHNAPAGYWGVATGAMASSTSLCAFDWSFGAGLIEALTWIACEQQPLLLMAYDAPYPEPLRTVRPVPLPFGMALALAPEPSARSLAQLTVGFEAASDRSDPGLPQGLKVLHDAIPAARSLRLLCALAREKHAEVPIDYLSGQQLLATISPP